MEEKLIEIKEIQIDNLRKDLDNILDNMLLEEDRSNNSKNWIELNKNYLSYINQLDNLGVSSVVIEDYIWRREGIVREKKENCSNSTLSYFAAANHGAVA